MCVTDSMPRSIRCLSLGLQLKSSVPGRFHYSLRINTIKVKRLVGASTESFLLPIFKTGTDSNCCLKHAVVQLNSIKHQWRLVIWAILQVC